MDILPSAIPEEGFDADHASEVSSSSSPRDTSSSLPKSPHGAIHFIKPPEKQAQLCPLSTRTTFTFSKAVKKKDAKKKKEATPSSTSSASFDFDDLSWPSTLNELDSFHENEVPQTVMERLPVGTFND